MFAFIANMSKYPCMKSRMRNDYEALVGEESEREIGYSLDMNSN